MGGPSTWVRSLTGIGLLLAAAALAACGSSEPSTTPAQQPEPATDPGTPTEDYSVSNYLSVSMTPVDDAGIFAVLDGTAPGEEEPVEATLRIGEGEADQVCRSELDGSTLVAFDAKTGESRVLSTSLPANEFGSSQVTPGEAFTLLSTYVPNSEIDDPDAFEYSLLDVDTGEATPLGTGPDAGKLCPTTMGFIGAEADDPFSPIGAISGSHLLTLHEARPDGPTLVVR